MKKRILCSLFTILLVLAFVHSGCTSANQSTFDPAPSVEPDPTIPVSVYVGDNLLTVEGIDKDGAIFLTMEDLAAALGKEIAWNGDKSTVYLSGTLSDEKKDGEYLKAYFGIAPFSGTVSRSSFDAALESISAGKTSGTGSLTVQEAVKAAVCAAEMEPLALTYAAPVDPGKVKERLLAYGVEGVADDYACYVAAALDTGMALSTFDFDAELDAKTAQRLLMSAVQALGMGRNYLGLSTDPDIYAKVRGAWNSFSNFDSATLSALGAELVIQGASTGYGLKYEGYDARFLPEYTLQYGHSDIIHALQLIGLLRSEGINAKVQLEPKVSIYEYMVEWGDPTQVESTPTYELREIEGGRWLCYAMEYDLQLEFETVEDKESFHSIVEDYAKKYDDRVDENGNFKVPLLSGSWWQPLYSSQVAMKNTSFKLLKDNVIRDGSYSIHPFSLPEDTGKIAAVVAAEAPDLAVELTDIYVNPAFYNYITGADHQ